MRKGAWCSVVLAIAMAGFGGCATMGTGTVDDPIAIQAATFAEPHESWLRPHLRPLFREGEWGAVLNFNRLGLEAMTRGQHDLAAMAFDESITRVEAIYANDENAAKARSLFNAEKVKDFKGEPYERSMLYFYRGLLYVHEGDFQNARAAFLAADRHDSLSSAESEQYAGDFGMMKYLASWASWCDGDESRGAQLAAEARAADPSIAGLPERPGRAMVLIDVGTGPRKVAEGEHRHILRFHPDSGLAPEVAVHEESGSTARPLVQLADLNYQATTRGGREIDGILDGKAQFKGTTNTVGTVALQAGAQMSMLGSIQGNRDVANAGLAGMLVGLIAKGVAQAATPAADVRAWSTLPARVMMASSNEASSKVSGYWWSGQPGPQPFALKTEGPQCSLAWARAGFISPEYSGTDEIDPMFREAETTRVERNHAFRAMLAERLAPLQTASGQSAVAPSTVK